MAKLIGDVVGLLIGLICGVALLGCFTLWQTTKEQKAALERWSVNYGEMVQRKNEEIEKLKWQFRTTPPQEKPRPKGRG